MILILIFKKWNHSAGYLARLSLAGIFLKIWILLLFIKQLNCLCQETMLHYFPQDFLTYSLRTLQGRDRVTKITPIRILLLYVSHDSITGTMVSVSWEYQVLWVAWESMMEQLFLQRAPGPAQLYYYWAGLCYILPETQLLCLSKKKIS